MSDLSWLSSIAWEVGGREAGPTVRALACQPLAVEARAALQRIEARLALTQDGSCLEPETVRALHAILARLRAYPEPPKHSKARWGPPDPQARSELDKLKRKQATARARFLRPKGGP